MRNQDQEVSQIADQAGRDEGLALLPHHLIPPTHITQYDAYNLGVDSFTHIVGHINAGISTANNAHVVGLADFLNIRCVNKEFHNMLQLF